MREISFEIDQSPIDSIRMAFKFVWVAIRGKRKIIIQGLIAEKVTYSDVNCPEDMIKYYDGPLPRIP